ncbi:MAG: flagellar biosynthetic protein FliO [Armatimonadota bacterium]|nr:flagellar biosynthetic protein FliO [Armatimonadota bacterium]MDR7563601.1 flagellar biosynthetic protein FliO [Armatimonadota bacterium]MDR7566849.1 flagellar biosynthetic protein FliO [Armatimonadota bacterium]MDR7601206.1 flagellar biosynthetic protein FliO [Armatimonadota bacterium]
MSTLLLAAAPPPSLEVHPASLLLRALAGLALVVGLVLLTRYLLLRMGPGGSPSTVRLREVARLGSHHVLYVVEVEGKRLLLGSQLSVLAELGPAPVEETETFGEKLRAVARRLRRLGEERR